MLNISRINAWFHSFGKVVIRFRWLVFALFIVLTAAAAAGLPRIEPDVDQDNWFMEDDALLKAKERMEHIFGNEDFCAALVTVDDVFTPENLRLLRELGDELMDKVPYADDVMSLADMEFTEGVEGGISIDDLVPERIPTDREALEALRQKALSKESMRNRMVSIDSTETWLILRLKTLPPSTNDEQPLIGVGHIFSEVVNQPKYASLHIKAAGLPVVFADKMDFFAKETPRLMGISLLCTVLVLFFLLRNVRGIVFPLLTVFCVMAVVFGAQGWLGIRTDPTVIFMPVFITLAVSIGYSIHLFNHFNVEFRKTGRRRESLILAMEEVGWPLVFSALTTMAALVSFMFIPLRPIRWVGLTSACLVFLACLVVLTLLPALLSFGKDIVVSDKPDKSGKRRESRIQGLMERLAGVSRRRKKLSLFVLAVGTVVCLVGLMRIDVSFDVLKTFGRRIPYVDRIYSVGQSQVGSLYSYNLALEFDQPGAAKDPENLRKFGRLVADIDNLELTKKTTSLLQILKDLNQVIHEGDPDWYRLPQSRDMVAQLLLLYENAGGDEVERWIDYDYQRLKLQVEMGHYNSGEAARELHWIRDEAGKVFPDAHVVLTGSISQYTVMQDYVSFGQIKSFFIAFTVVTLLMMIVFGSLRIGLIAMIPNIAPALVVAAIMGFADIPLDLVTVTIMPMLLGLAVDDTIHFINHCQLEFERCGEYVESNRRTFLAVGGALLMTTVVVTLNFSAYMVSVVKIFVSIGFLVGAGLFAALAADFFITPVLLAWAKPFGREKRP